MEVAEIRNSDSKHVALKREVGLASAVNFMLSFVIGTGIFVTPGTVLAQSGSVGMTLLIWAVGGFISFLASLPFGELSSVVPKSGMIYTYLFTSFNHMHPFFGGIPAFTFFMMMYVIILPCSISLGALLFSEYTWVIIENMFDVGDGKVVKNILGAVILGHAIKFNPGFEGTNYSVTAITQSLYFCLYTYDGGSFITTVTEEMKNPEKNILRSILIGLTIVTITFILLNVTFLTVLTPEEVSNSTTVIAKFAIKLFGVAGGAASSVVICLSLLTSMMSGMFCASRIGYVAAREGHMMDFFCYIHKSRQTPAPAVIAQVLLALGFYFFVRGNANALIDTYAFFIWLSYGMAMVCVLLLRKQLPDAPRPYRVPTIIPVLVAALSANLFVTSLISGPSRIIIIFVICVSLSSLIYFIFIFRKLRFSSIARLQKKLQHMFGLVLPSEEPPF